GGAFARYDHQRTRRKLVPAPIHPERDNAFEAIELLVHAVMNVQGGDPSGIVAKAAQPPFPARLLCSNKDATLSPADVVDTSTVRKKYEPLLHSRAYSLDRGDKRH